MGSAFHTFFRGLVKNLGLLFFDPLVPANRAIAAPFLANAVGHIAQVIPALRERDKELAEAGYHAQVHVEQDTSLLFLIENGKRIALRYKDGRFAAKDRSYKAEELQEKALQLSPNALLRPVMQDYLLPTIAYVGGPSEIAYMAQAEVLYRDLLGRMPIIFPRNSYTLLDEKATKLLHRYHLTPPQLLGPRDQIESRIAASLVPTEMLEEFRSARSAVDGALAKFQSRLTEFDPTLGKFGA